MISNNFAIVICSTDDQKFNSFKRNVVPIFGEDIRIIRVADAKSIAEGYNRGVRMATSDIVIFCHDDIEFLNRNVPEIITTDLVDYDIVGVAGTTRLTDGRWHTAGKKHVHGKVAHSCDHHGAEYQICIYGESTNSPVVSNIQALDGLFFAVRGATLKHTHFDENFDGFHLYDLDFTFSAYLKGYRLAVDHRIHLLHHSGGRYNQDWEKYYHRFNEKYENVFINSHACDQSAIKRITAYGRGELDSVMGQLNSPVGSG